MHIGVLTHNYPRFAGDFSGTFIEALCREMAVQGQRVTVWAPYDPAYKRPLIEGDVALHLYRYAWPDSLHRLGYMRTMQSDLALRLEAYLLSPALFSSGIATMLRQCRKVRPDILHAHWVLPNGFIGAVASLRLGIPLVVSVPGSDAQVAGKNALFRAMARFAFGQASLLTANSESLRDSVIDLGADPAKFDLILYGTDPDVLQPDATGVPALRTRLGIAENDTVFLCVGRMVPKKGFDQFVRAMAEPSLRRREVTGILVGEGDEWVTWQSLAGQLGVSDCLRWVGNVPRNQIGVYYNLADVLVMPSVSRPADGLNVCVLEAMSCGKAVVGSGVAGNPLAIIPGETGYIVPERDTIALANALAQLADDPALRKRMGGAGRKRVENELGWPSIAHRYIEHFKRVQREFEV